ncbi:ABC transporter ATP-binding protein [Sinorhizobium medicae]|uniref:Glutathione import ATP-binding protein GsiA n=1 Tax=Sinorhizobium medicae TaxID=110321 RepID=A0A508XC28_9HYPH|nr:ABC transporter ATP-binding protein [Sinorhizobium medicae]VTZ65847.1 Glutathione import ATP-binding protein GsiA [Sinorhizobium medicae]
MTDLHRNPAETVLAVRSLDVSLPRNMERSHAVKGVSLDLRQGEILCIVGESGSGKSVTASTIMGLLPPAMRVTGGEILYQGRDLIAMPEAERRQMRGKAISMIFQDPLSALNPLMTIEQQIDEVLVAHGVTNRAERERRVLELITEVGLPDPPLIRRQYPFRLSGGQRQRVMIAIALALDPDVLIADEPTTALDVTIQAQILDLIRRLQAKKNTSVMFITHDFGVVADIADRVVVMEKGLVVEDGTASDVLRNPQHPYTRRLIAAVPRLRELENEAKEAETVLEVRSLGKTYRSHAGLFGKMRIVPAVDNVSFTLRRGETLGVVGESGSGKSSMGKVLMKLVEADSGEILLGGRDIRPMSEAEFRAMRPRIQMIFQDPFASLNPRLTVGTSLTVGPGAHGLGREEAHRRALGLLERVGLGAAAYERYPHEFSGGQRQRVGIARALMFDPQIIVADEAVSALDVSIQAQILQLLAEVQAEKHLAMIFITHDLRVASQICDQVIVMNRGRVVEAGTPTQIFRNPQEAYSRQLVQAIPGVDW